MVLTVSAPDPDEIDWLALPSVTVLAPEPVAVNDWPTAAPSTTTDAAVELPLVTPRFTVAGTVTEKVPEPADKVTRSTLLTNAFPTLAAANVMLAVGTVLMVNVSLPAPPSIVEFDRNAYVDEMPSSAVVVTAEALVLRVLLRFAAAAFTVMVLPVPCEPINRSVAASAVTPVSVTTVSFAPCVPATA